MHFSTIAVTSALAVTALAAPNAQWHPRPGQYGRPSSSTKKATSTVSDEDCAAPTATTTAYITITEHDEATTSASASTSTTVIVDPTGGSSTSTTVIVDPTGASSSSVIVDPTGITSSSEVVEPTGSVSSSTSATTIIDPFPTECSNATATLTETTIYTDTATSYITVTAQPSANPTLPYPGSNTTVSSFPTSTPEPEQDCITEDEASELAEVFRLLIQEYSDELALAALTEDFVDYSSAVNILMNKGAQYPKNITGPTFATRAAFMSGQGSQPKIPFERLNTFHGCDSVSVRWITRRSANGQKTEVAMVPVVGNGIMHVVRSEEAIQTHNGVTYNWRVKELYSEFNAAAWLINLGVFHPEGPVDYIVAANSTNTTTKRDALDTYDPSLRGPMI